MLKGAAHLYTHGTTWEQCSATQSCLSQHKNKKEDVSHSFTGNNIGWCGCKCRQSHIPLLPSYLPTSLSFSFIHFPQPFSVLLSFLWCFCLWGLSMLYRLWALRTHLVKHDNPFLPKQAAWWWYCAYIFGVSRDVNKQTLVLMLNFSSQNVDERISVIYKTYRDACAHVDFPNRLLCLSSSPAVTMTQPSQSTQKCLIMWRSASCQSADSVAAHQSPPMSSCLQAWRSQRSESSVDDQHRRRRPVNQWPPTRCISDSELRSLQPTWDKLEQCLELSGQSCTSV